MAINPKFLESQIRNELSKLTDKRLINQISEGLVNPIRIFRNWDYGELGQQYPCWTVFAHTGSGTGVAYCEYGFGPEFPWGLITLSDNARSMGQDCEWFESFLAAYLDSFAPTHLDIWRVFRTTNREDPIPITTEAGWNDTWGHVMKMRELEPELNFDCKCDAEIELSISQRNRNEVKS